MQSGSGSDCTLHVCRNRSSSFPRTELQLKFDLQSKPEVACRAPVVSFFPNALLVCAPIEPTFVVTAVDLTRNTNTTSALPQYHEDAEISMFRPIDCVQTNVQPGFRRVSCALALRVRRCSLCFGEVGGIGLVKRRRLLGRATDQCRGGNWTWRFLDHSISWLGGESCVSKQPDGVTV